MMNDKFRIVLEDHLLPVQAFFNAIPDRSFIETLQAFRQGTGAGFNETYCGFPGEEEFDEEVLDGIEFAIRDEQVVLSYDEFFRLLSEVCQVFLEKYPNKKGEVSELLTGIRDMLTYLDSPTSKSLASVGCVRQ